jgi:hypothetical protein
MPEAHPHVPHTIRGSVRSLSLCVRAPWIRYRGMRPGAAWPGNAAGSESGDGFAVCPAPLSLAAADGATSSAHHRVDDAGSARSISPFPSAAARRPHIVRNVTYTRPGVQLRRRSSRCGQRMSPSCPSPACAGAVGPTSRSSTAGFTEIRKSATPPVFRGELHHAGSRGKAPRFDVTLFS